jgi:hypothetical protein
VVPEEFHEVMEKVYNTRFNEIMDVHAEQTILKGKGHHCLCATLPFGKQRKQGAAVDNTSTSVPISTSKRLLPWETGAASDKLLSGNIFILSGSFHEMVTQSATAEEQTKK